jgi:hypothetical protein
MNNDIPDHVYKTSSKETLDTIKRPLEKEETLISLRDTTDRPLLHPAPPATTSLFSNLPTDISSPSWHTQV